MDTRGIIDSIYQETGGQLKHVYFVACGGSQAALFPGMYFLQSEAKTFGVSSYNSNEFVHATPAMLDDRCICILCSRNATKETVEATKVANARGAQTIAMTGFATTEMAQTGKHVVVYSNGDEQVYSENNQSNALRLCFDILRAFENYGNYDAAIAAYGVIDEVISSAIERMQDQAIRFANGYKDEPLFYVMASGPLYNAAYTMACCHFMEMQCKHAVYLHDGEYFHGPFETTDADLPIVLMLSEGRTRPLDERCLDFLNRYAKKIILLDIREMGIEKIHASVREFFNSIIMIPIERLFVSEMAKIRNHPMETRRYMWKVPY